MLIHSFVNNVYVHQILVSAVNHFVGPPHVVSSVGISS